MKYLAVLAMFLVFAALFGSSWARSEPVCGYVNSKGEQIFLKYFSYSQEGEQYKDLDANGKCLKKVTCLSNYTTKIEDC